MKQIRFFAFMSVFLLLFVCSSFASDYHILKTKSKDHGSRAVFHIAVPDENNSAAVHLWTAVSQELAASGRAITEVPWLETDFADEYLDIQNGKIYEHAEDISYNADLTAGQKRAIFDARFEALEASIPDTIRTIMKWWGYNRDVPE